MRAREFSTGLSKALGVDQSALKTLDRALAEARLRRKSVGRKTFSITRLEAVRIVIGIAIARQLMHAADVVAEREKFRLSGNHDATLAEFLGITAGMRLFGAIGLACEKLAADEKPHGIWIEIEQDGGAEIRVKRDGFEGKLRFLGVKSKSHITRGMTTRHTFNPQALAWIGRVTDV